MTLVSSFCSTSIYFYGLNWVPNVVFLRKAFREFLPGWMLVPVPNQQQANKHWKQIL